MRYTRTGGFRNSFDRGKGVRMFVGHFAVGLAAKRVTPRISLGTLFLSVQFVDLLWPIFLLLGLEHVRIDPGNTAVTPLDFYDYPITHSLVGAAGWALGFGLVYFAVRRYALGAWVLGAGVLSHWILDAVAHRPDLLLVPGGETAVGLGLWHSVAGTAVVELGLFAAGCAIYLRSTAARDRVGRYGLWALLGFLLLIQLVNYMGSPPPNETALAVVALAQWLFILGVYWVDRHRKVTALTEGSVGTSKEGPDRYAAWEKYRDQVAHPVTVYSADDFARARENLERHAWARRVMVGMVEQVAHTLEQGSDYIEQMIPTTTPGGTGFTNCPVCEGNTIHGAYHWSPKDPERLICTTCETVYPNEKYPEDIEFRADRYGGGQVITYHGGYSFDFRGFSLRSSWTAQIRSRKVGHMAGQAQTLATVYALTGERAYAEAARAILLRFTEVYPNYLVHSSYGEWIDLPPHLVAERINDLPEDEWTIPPNKPDRKLHSGYWNSGRATGSGMEGVFIRHLATAYDFIHDILTDDERVRIEKDLLIEGTILLLADPALNNKSVSNLTGAGMVGMAVGDPGLVRTGTEGFWHFIRRWFLFDGTTSESPAYGMMTLNGLWNFGEALHGYSDPEGYREQDWMQDVDVYADGDCRAVYQAFYDMMLPNLRYPASADSYVPTSLGTQYAELMVARYGFPKYRALLGELLDGPPEETGGEYALFYRDPDFSIPAADRVVFEDVFFPALRMGYFRRGADGREGTVILDASHWGVHHHRDSLNLTLFQEGHEILTDLGYLWDRPDKDMTVRTPAHNLVVVDESEQRTQERLGSLHLFDVTPHVKVVDCSSAAYEQADLYRRACVLVNHGKDGAYLVDMFAVSGGKSHDYLFHGPIPGGDAQDIELSPADGPTPYGIQNVRCGSADGPWHLTWQMDASVRFRAWALPGVGEDVIIGEGWGERGWGHFNTPDKKVDIPYVIRRRTGEAPVSVFVSVFEVYEGAPLVRGVNRLAVSGEGVGLEVETRLGKDVIVGTLKGGPRRVETSRGVLETDGRFTVASSGFLYLAEGTQARFGERKVVLNAGRLEGEVQGIVNGNDASYFVAGGLANAAGLSDRVVLVDDGESTTGYRVRGVDAVDGEVRIYTKRDGRGYDVGGGKQWAAPLSGCHPE